MHARELTSDLVVLVLAIFDSSQVHGSLVGEDLATGNKVAVAGVENSVQHALIEEEVTHPLGDDDINLGVREDNLFHFSLEESDLVRQAVASDNLLGLLDDRGHIHTDYVLSTSLSSKPVEPYYQYIEQGPLLALTTYMLRIPVPQPTSRTTLSLKM